MELSHTDSVQDDILADLNNSANDIDNNDDLFHAIHMRRIASAPAVAERVSTAQLPSTLMPKFEDMHDSSMFHMFPVQGDIPSRLNPRLPQQQQQQQQQRIIPTDSPIVADRTFLSQQSPAKVNLSPSSQIFAPGQLSESQMMTTGSEDQILVDSLQKLSVRTLSGSAMSKGYLAPPSLISTNSLPPEYDFFQRQNDSVFPKEPLAKQPFPQREAPLENLNWTNPREAYSNETQRSQIFDSNGSVYSPYGMISPRQETVFDASKNGPQNKGYARLSSATPKRTLAVDPDRESAILENFRRNYGKPKQMEIADLAGHYVALCRDKLGSRFIQEKFDYDLETVFQPVFHEILPHILDLSTDIFGNYVVQKLYEHAESFHRDILLKPIMANVYKLSTQTYGCRVVQKVIELGTTDSLKLVVAEFEHSHIIHCAQNPNGNHVLQKCIEFTSKIITSSPDKNEVHGLYAVLDYIVAALQSKAREMSRNPYGCRVIQRIMEYCTENQKSQVLIEIRDHFKELIKDQYGNYVIQHLIRYGGATDRASLTKIILTNLVDFLQHKFASNVVEKFLQYTNRFDRDEVIWTLIKMLFDTPLGVKLGNSILDTMLKNSYANYVIQKVVDVSDTRQREVIVGYFTENAGHIRKYANGKRIIAHLEKVTGLKF